MARSATQRRLDGNLVTSMIAAVAPEREFCTQSAVCQNDAS